MKIVVLEDKDHNITDIFCDEVVEVVVAVPVINDVVSSEGQTLIYSKLYNIFTVGHHSFPTVVDNESLVRNVFLDFKKG